MTLIYYFSFIFDIFQQLITGLVCRLDRLQSIVDSVRRHRYYSLYSILIMTVILEWCWQAGAAVDRSEAGCARMRLFGCGPPVYRVSAARANKDPCLSEYNDDMLIYFQTLRALGLIKMSLTNRSF